MVLAVAAAGALLGASAEVHVGLALPQCLSLAWCVAGCWDPLSAPSE